MNFVSLLAGFSPFDTRPILCSQHLRLTQLLLPQGSYILSHLIASSKVSQVHSLMRRAYPHPLSDPDSKLKSIISADTESWPGKLSSTPADTFISALGSVRGDVGSFEAQRKIDLDLNLDLAKAAKATGVKTYILISGGPGNSTSPVPYFKMKGELEEAVLSLGFQRIAILRPGLIIGSRERTRVLEQLLQNVAKLLGALSYGKLKDFWAQDAEVIGRAASRIALEDDLWEGKETNESGKRVWIVSQTDILAIGRGNTS